MKSGLIQKIYIIQSLKSTDPYSSGKILSVEISNAITNEFAEITSRDELFTHLDKIESELSGTNGINVIHFDCHGNENGIALFDANNKMTFITWEDLRDSFRKIYVTTRVKPVISFSCCKGINVLKLLARAEPCPYDFVTGSLIDIPFDDSVLGYRDFYLNLHASMDIESNINQIRNSYPLLQFFAFNALTLAEKAWEKYQETQLTPEKIKERKEEILNQVRDRRGFVTPDDESFIDANLTKESGLIAREEFMRTFLS